MNSNDKIDVSNNTTVQKLDFVALKDHKLPFLLCSIQTIIGNVPERS